MQYSLYTWGALHMRLCTKCSVFCAASCPSILPVVMHVARHVNGLACSCFHAIVQWAGPSDSYLARKPEPIRPPTSTKPPPNKPDLFFSLTEVQGAQPNPFPGLSVGSFT